MGSALLPEVAVACRALLPFALVPATYAQCGCGAGTALPALRARRDAGAELRGVCAASRSVPGGQKLGYLKQAPRTSPWILIPAAKTFQLHCLSAHPLAEVRVAPGLAVCMLPSQRSAGTRRALRLLQGLDAVSLSSSG